MHSKFSGFPSQARLSGWKGSQIVIFTGTLFLTMVYALLQFELSRTPATPPTQSVVRVKYCGDGHFFEYIVSKLRQILKYEAVDLETTIDTPDLILGSTGDLCLNQVGIPRVTVLGENIGMDRLSYLENLMNLSTIVLHCVKLDAPLQNLVYYPFWVTHFGERREKVPRDLIKSRALVKGALAKKTKFCAFMYSHPSERRDKVYRLLNSYKEVDSLGPYPPSDKQHDRFVYNDNQTFYDLAVRHYEEYKFVIAGENSEGKGYITEKIVSPMLAYSIPIYIGAPDIAVSFNPESFVNANDLDEYSLLSIIKHLDGDDFAYAKMLEKPWFKGNRLPSWFELSNLSSILQPLTTALLSAEISQQE